MRTTVVVSLALVAVFAVVLTAGMLSSVVQGSRQETIRQATYVCNAALGPTQGVDANKGRADAARLSDQARGTAAHIISIGKQRNLPALAWQIAIQASMTESRLINVNYGDRDSLGLFQMRPSMGWGTAAQVLDPMYAINTFYDRLLKLPDWTSTRPGDSAQAIERSAFPDRYNQWEAMASYLVSDIGQVQDPSGCGPGSGNMLPAATAAASKAEAFALSQAGKPYLWGGAGPNAFDCSGLMLRAYESAGLILPRVAADQFRAGAYLPVRDAQPGDLLFWATDRSNPLTIHHVAMYLGNNTIVEAAHDGVPVGQRTISWSEPDLMPQAVRPGV